MIKQAIPLLLFVGLAGSGVAQTPTMDLRNVEDLTARQNKVTWSDE
jgi:hypothetical protein